MLQYNIVCQLDLDFSWFRVETLTIPNITTDPPPTCHRRTLPRDFQPLALEHQIPHWLHRIPKVRRAHRVWPTPQKLWLMCPTILVHESLPQIVVNSLGNTSYTCRGDNELALVADRYVLASS
jgi:hypothetical protein